MVETYSLILFDLDGTLSDPLIGIGRSINHALMHFNFPSLELTEISQYIGPPMDQTFATITGSSDPALLASLVAKYRERYADIGYSENTLYEGIPEALTSLGAAGLPLAVCTSKRKDFAERILEMFGLRAHFQFVNGGDVGVQKWQQIQDLRSKNAIDESSIMVGDRAIDLVAAHRNGLYSAGVLWGHGRPEELVNERPQHIFTAPSQLAVLAGG